MSIRLVCVCCLVCYLLVIVPFTEQLRQRPVAVKLGYMPEAEALKLVAGDQSSLLAEVAVVKVLFYYGTLVEFQKQKISLPIEYPNMFKMLQTAAKLDPYNMDAYYFAQAAFTWEVGRAKEVNDLLAYGMRYRTNDFYLPYFAGFNAAYFLKDYACAAIYMKKAAEISGEPLFANLAARYFYDSGQNSLGIYFIKMMMQGAKDPQIRRVYQLRYTALLAAEKIQNAVRQFSIKMARQPENISELVVNGFLDQVPSDPYGGKFYLTGSGAVQTTSKFAFAGNR